MATQVVTGSNLFRSTSHGIIFFHRACLEQALQLRLHRYEPGFFPHRCGIWQFHLPDKEFRYLRTIIVIADIHQGLYSATLNLFRDQERPYLTFWHWSGVTPYTYSCEFAGSCVFGKQSPGILSLRPLNKEGQALFRRYGRFFAEFLGVLSLVRLALLELITCVGLRYGRT